MDLGTNPEPASKYYLLLVYERLWHSLLPDELVFCNLYMPLRTRYFLISSNQNYIKYLKRSNKMFCGNICRLKDKITSGTFDKLKHIGEYLFTEILKLLSKRHSYWESLLISPHKDNKLKNILNLLPLTSKVVVFFEAKKGIYGPRAMR